MTALATHTYLPPNNDGLTELSRALHAQHAALVAPDGSRLEMPAAVHDALVQVVESMMAGKAVHVTPVDQLLTTQQAADLLGVTRPTLVAIIERAELPCERVGTHRRIRMDDLLEYREQRRQSQLRAIAALYGDDEDELDREAVAAQAKAARKAVAAARRARQAPRSV